MTKFLLKFGWKALFKRSKDVKNWYKILFIKLYSLLHNWQSGDKVFVKIWIQNLPIYSSAKAYFVDVTMYHTRLLKSALFFWRKLSLSFSFSEGERKLILVYYYIVLAEQFWTLAIKFLAFHRSIETGSYKYSNVLSRLKLLRKHNCKETQSNLYRK